MFKMWCMLLKVIFFVTFQFCWDAWQTLEAIALSLDIIRALLSHGCVAYLFIAEICMMYSKTLRSILRKPPKSPCNLRKWSCRHKMCNIHALCVFVYSKEIFLQSEAKSRLAAQIAAKFDWRSPNRSASGENRPRPSFLNTINQVYILQVTLKWGLKSSLLVRPILV